jgi:hypothetical protein
MGPWLTTRKVVRSAKVQLEELERIAAASPTGDYTHVRKTDAIRASQAASRQWLAATAPRETTRQRVLHWLRFRDSKAAAIAAGVPEPKYMTHAFCGVVADLHAMAAAKGWPSYAVPFLERLLITRGAAKAFEMRRELASFCELFESCTAELRQIHAGVKAVEVHPKLLKGTINRLKQMHTLEGVIETAADLGAWARQIEADPSTRMFGASDSTKGTCTRARQYSLVLSFIGGNGTCPV